MAQRMIELLKLKNAFHGSAISIGDCLSFDNSTVLYIKDDEQTKISAFAPRIGDHNDCLKVVNSGKQEIALLSIDNKLMKDIKNGVADCALFNDIRFWLIEFKTNAKGNTHKAIEFTYRKAIDQLSNTIEIFKEKTLAVNVDFINVSNLQCNMVTTFGYPRMKAMEMELSIAFAEQHAGVSLTFEREINANIADG